MSRYINASDLEKKLSKLNESISQLEHDKERVEKMKEAEAMLSRTINGRKYVFSKGVWMPLDEYVQRELEKPIWDRNFVLGIGQPSYTRDIKGNIISQSELNIEALKSKIEELLEEIEYCHRKINKLEAELRVPSDKRLEALQEKLRQAANTNSGLYSEIEKLNKRIVELQEENKRLGFIDQLDFYMKYQYPEDSISPNTAIRYMAQAAKEKYESRVGAVKFPEIKETLDQHKDLTPGDMIETFHGIYEVWEKHPELNLSELMCKVFSKKSATMTDEEFIKILKEAYNG